MLNYSEMPDMDLVACLKAQDHAAFTEIYQRHWRAMLIYAQTFLRDRDEAADVVQDIFTTLWNRSGELQIVVGLKNYLFISVRNQCLKVIVRSNRADAYAQELAACSSEDMDHTDGAVNFRELCQLIDDALDAMPTTMRAVYVANKQQDLSHRTIAQELGITEQSSRTLLNRALNSLRSKLSPLLSLVLLYWHP